MRKILLLIALIVPNILWAAGADSTRASLHIVKRGDSTLVRSTARIVPEDSVVIGNPRAPGKAGGRVDSLYVKHLNFTTVTTQAGTATASGIIDSSAILDGGVAGGDLTGTLSGNKIWTGTQTFKDSVIIDTGAFGTESDGAKSNIVAADSLLNATTIAQTGTVTLTSGNNLWRATGAVTISQVTTVGRQIGQVRGSYPTTWGGSGIELGDVLAALNTKSIPRTIRPGGNGTFLNGGVLQIMSQGTVAINAAILDSGSTITSDGGGSGGLVIIVSSGTISGSSAINVSGANGHPTAAAKGGAGGYSGEPGGHAGIGGSGGGGVGGESSPAGSGGAGFVPGKVASSGGVANNGGGSGGSVDAYGGDPSGNTGGAGGNGSGALSSTHPAPTILLPLANRSASTAATAGGNGGGTGGAAGSNGGGGGGGGSDGTTGGDGGNGGDGGSGGGGGGRDNSAPKSTGGNGATGNAFFYRLSSNSIYAGLPGGQGGGGGGAGIEAGGTGGAGAAGITPFVTGHGAGSGGVGASGGSGSGATTGVGGAGGNGGGAAGMVILIAPTVTYSGTVTGRLVIIEGDRAEYILRGIFKR